MQTRNNRNIRAYISGGINTLFVRPNTPIDWGDPTSISSRGPAQGLVGVWDGSEYFRVSIWGRVMEYIISTV